MELETKLPTEISTGKIDVSTKRKRTSSKVDVADFQKKLAAKRSRDNELVTVRFRNLECGSVKGRLGIVRFSAKFHKGDHFDTFELIDGNTYKLPRSVVNHLRNNCAYIEHEQLSDQFSSQFTGGYSVNQAYDEHGKMNRQKSMSIERKRHRFAVEVLEYMDDDKDYVPDIMLVKPSQMIV